MFSVGAARTRKANTLRRSARGLVAGREPSHVARSHWPPLKVPGSYSLPVGNRRGSSCESPGVVYLYCLNPRKATGNHERMTETPPTAPD